MDLVPIKRAFWLLSNCPKFCFAGYYVYLVYIVKFDFEMVFLLFSTFGFRDLYLSCSFRVNGATFFKYPYLSY